MSDFVIINQPQPGLYLLECPRYLDHRGDFAKIFHREALNDFGLEFAPAETFVSRSHLGVLRGMHFQVAEAAHEKLVFCAGGRALDVVVDIRPESPHFNQPFVTELSPESGRSILIPKGYAHGFLALEDNCCMIYHVSTLHAPSHDRGVLWSSINFEWPIENPSISMRDSAHPMISELP